jgi:hypothetical protein
VARARLLPLALLALFALAASAFAQGMGMHPDMNRGMGMRQTSPPHSGPYTGPGTGPNLEPDIRALAAPGDRSPGSMGIESAAAYLKAELARALPGVPVNELLLSVPVRVGTPAGLTLDDGRQAPLSPLLLNALSPETLPPGGVRARAIWAAGGGEAAFNGLDPSGAVVFMEMESGKHWQNAAMLGARALVFVSPADPGNAPRSRFEDKRELTPIDFPRLWIDRANARELFGELEAPRELPMVLVESRIRWTEAEARALWCLVPGADPALDGELAVLQAFYDSTTLAPGRAPGADEAASAAALLDIARELGRRPPARPTLLLLTPGHSASQAGARRAAWAMHTGQDSQLARREEQAARLDAAGRTAALLSLPEPLAHGVVADPEAVALLKPALDTRAKIRVDELTTRLMRLRLAEQRDEEEIRALAARRMALKRLAWVGSSPQAAVALTDQEREVLRPLLADEAQRQREIAVDAAARLRELDSCLELARAVNGRSVAAGAALHLSSHGTGLGAFEQGWLYDLSPELNRTRTFANLHDAFNEAAGTAQEPGGEAEFRSTLRPDRLVDWRSLLPDRPQLGGEPFALAGLPVATLATTADARARWGTPYDTPENVRFGFLNRQQELVRRLARRITGAPEADAGMGHGMRSPHEAAVAPIPAPDAKPADHFSSLSGHAKIMRRGELFPDQPVAGALFQTFVGPSLFPALSDSRGVFRVVGIPDRKATIHKAIIEGFRFDPETGRADLAMDKPLTGKDAYRVRISGRDNETHLVLFGCAQSTFFSLHDPRTFEYLYRPRLIDARTEAEPLRYWYSRLDTRQSTLGTFFLEPGVPLKLALSDTLTATKTLLLNADEDHPQGLGFTLTDRPTVPLTELAAARDMWTLLLPRIHNLESRGIYNERIRDLWQRGSAAMERAEAARGGLEWNTALEEGRTALSLASQVYNTVSSTQKDVLFGVLFYVALFVPFAYCMERLLFGFADIHKRIIAFLGLLAAVIGAVYLVHPAFQLTYNPLVVVLAFFIIGLSLLVSAIIYLRFEREMTDLQRRAHHMRPAGIGKGAAFVAAFVLGVSNLRRRPSRTILTIATLVILTFTIMNFTAVKSTRQYGWARFGPEASYDGMLMKQRGWKDLPVEALGVVENAFPGRTAPRVWYTTQDLTRPASIPVTLGKRTATARGMVGLAACEPAASGLDAALDEGRWLAHGADDEVLLPREIADTIGAHPGSVVEIWGIPFRVAGILDGARYDARPDLDGEPVTPIHYPNEAAGKLSDVEAEAIEEGEDLARFETRYQHLSGSETVILPARTLLSLGGSLKAIAFDPGAGLRGTAEDDGEKGASHLGDRFGTLLFRGVTTGADKGVSAYFASDVMKYSGMSNVLVPLVISVLIVLNTMISSVYERKREIAVYTSVGLAPSHVSFLFVAEALAFAVISVVIGYLLAQTSANLLAGTALWQGMTANYSSMAGVAAMLLVMAVVLVSAIYPSRVAASIAIPDVNRAWSMPDAEGDELSLVLPFLIKMREQKSAGGFLQHYYHAHHDVSHGLFSTGAMDAEVVTPASERFREMGLSAPDDQRECACIFLNLEVWLAPFDFGVRQKVRLVFCPSETYRGFLQIRVFITRLAGEYGSWKALNKGFLDDLRKQLLVWRSLDEQAEAGFARAMEKTLGADALGESGGLGATGETGDGREQPPAPAKSGDAHA